MNQEQKHELMFIIAKYLKTTFPDVADMFIQRCEADHLFPSPVFSANASFQELQSLFLQGVPDDQLVKIISHVRNQSKFSSLLATTTNSSFHIKSGDVITHKIGLPFPPFQHFNAHHRVVGHTNKIYCLSVDFTSQILITGSDDNAIKLWKVPELTLMKTYNINCDSITDIAIHPSNRYFGSSSHDSNITIFSLESGVILKKIYKENMVHNLKFSPCGNFFGAACEEGCVSIYSFHDAIAEGEGAVKPLRNIYSPHRRPAAWLSFSPCGEFVAFSADPDVIVVASTGINSKNINSKNINSKNIGSKCVNIKKSNINSIRSNNKKGCINNNDDDEINNISSNNKYNDGMNSILTLRGHSGLPDFVFFSRTTCARLLSLSMHERGVRLWETKGNKAWGAQTFLPTARKNRIWRCVFNSDETRIIGASSSSICVWDTHSKQQTFILSHNEFTDHSTIVVAHPTIPSVVFVATSKGRTSLWDILSGQLIKGLQCNEAAEVNEALWSPDGAYVFTSDSDGGVTIYMESASDLARNAESIPYTEEFFLTEIDKNEEEPSEENLIGDRIGNPLLPQPQRWFLRDLRLRIRQQRTFSSKISEEEMLNTLKTMIAAQNVTNADEKEEGSGSESEGEYSRDRERESIEREERLQRRHRVLESESDSTVDISDNHHFFRNHNNSNNHILNHNTNSSNNTNNSINSQSRSRNRNQQKRKNSRIQRVSLSSDNDASQSTEISSNSSDSEINNSNSNSDSSSSSSSKSSSSDNESNVNTPSRNNLPVALPQLPDWTFSVKIAIHTYIPQIGEKVVYIRRGHEEWHKECNFMRFKTPYQIRRDLPQIAEARISDIHFYISHLVITLQFDDFESRIAYPVPDSPPFIVRKTRFEKSMKYFEKVRLKDIVKVELSASDGSNNILLYECEVKSIASKWKSDPWSCVSVIFLDDHKPGTLQPWELIFSEPKQHSSAGNEGSNETDEEKITQMMDNILPIVAEMLHKKAYQPFFLIRSPEMQKTLRSQAKLPVDLSLISDRLANHWYTNIHSIRSDVKLLKTNTLVLRKLDGEIADEIVKKLMSAIELNKKSLKMESSDDEEAEEASEEEEEIIEIKQINDNKNNKDHKNRKNNNIKKIKKLPKTNETDDDKTLSDSDDIVMKKILDFPPPIPTNTRSIIIHKLNTSPSRNKRNKIKKIAESSSNSSSIVSSSVSSSSIVSSGSSAVSSSSSASDNSTVSSQNESSSQSGSEMFGSHSDDSSS